MLNSKKILAIIPARSGSKGLPGKNTMTLLGKPLLAYPIEAAKQSKFIDKIIVSTNDENIASISQKAGADIPFIRPQYLAEDHSSSFDVIVHAVSILEKNGEQFDILCLLEPTSPLTEACDIDDALQILEKSEDIADSIVGVCKVDSYHPRFLSKIGNNGTLEPFMAEEFNAPRRQELEPLFFFEGSLYISKVKSFLQKKGFYHDKTLPYIVPKWKSIEIDDMLDFLVVETIMNNREKFT